MDLVSIRTDRVGRGAVALFVATLFLLSPLASILHAGDHGHRFCAEHLTFEDAPSEGERIARAAAPGFRRDSTSPATPEHFGSESHDPCALAPACLHEAITGEPRSPSSTIVTSAEVASPKLERVVAGLAPLFVAPKNSPPAAPCLT